MKNHLGEIINLIFDNDERIRRLFDLNKERRKERYLLIYTRENDIYPKLIINVNAPFRYYSDSLPYKIKEEPKKNIGKYYLDKLIEKIIFEIASSNISEKDIESRLEREIDYLKENSNFNEKDLKYIRKNVLKNIGQDFSYDNSTKEIFKKIDKKTEESIFINNEIINASRNRESGIWLSTARFKDSDNSNAHLILESFKEIEISNKELSDVIDYCETKMSRVDLDMHNENATVQIDKEIASKLNLIDQKTTIEMLKNVEENVRMKNKEIIFEIIHDLTLLKSDNNSDEKLSLLENKKDKFLKILSRKSFNEIYPSNLNKKVEDILNLILTDNIWLFGYDSSIGDKSLKHTKAFETKGVWKPDLVVQKADKTFDIYELKLSSKKVYYWDQGHKCYYPNAALARAVSQIENQHQFLLGIGSKGITKNDTLNIVIGMYENEIDECSISPNEIKYHGSIEDAIQAKIIAIRLLRNKYKNAKIIFYDELDILN